MSFNQVIDSGSRVSGPLAETAAGGLLQSVRSSRIVTRSCILTARPGVSPRDRHSLDPDR